MKRNFKKTLCGGALAISLAAGALLPATAMALDYDPYNRGVYCLEYSMAYTGYKSRHQRRGYDDLGFSVWRKGKWASAGAKSWANVTGIYNAKTYTADFVAA